MAGHRPWAEVRNAAIHERAKDRNEGREPDELHLAYEAEMWRLRMERDWLLAEAGDETRAKFHRLMKLDEATDKDPTSGYAWIPEEHQRR